MYWRAETAEAWQAFWQQVRGAATVDLPPLTPPARIQDALDPHWTRDDLVLSMTCGFPFRTRLYDKVRYVGTFDFGLGDARGHYHSVIVARTPQLDETPVTLAFNSRDSQSGFACIRDPDPRNPSPHIKAVIETGSHGASIAAVADGRADLAYIDAVTWRIWKTYGSHMGTLWEIGRTGPTPGLPLITGLDQDPAPLRTALAAALADLTVPRSQALGGLSGMAVLDETAYLTVPDLSPDLSHLP